MARHERDRVGLEHAGPSHARLPAERTVIRRTTLTLAAGARVTQQVNWYGERSVVLRHLAPATYYTFSVEASDFNGNTTMSNAVTL